MNTKGGVRDLLTALVRDNPDRPQFQLLCDFIVVDGVVDEDRFAMVMLFATRLVAFVPGAAGIFASQVAALRQH